MSKDNENKMGLALNVTADGEYTSDSYIGGGKNCLDETVEDSWFKYHFGNFQNEDGEFEKALWITEFGMSSDTDKLTPAVNKLMDDYSNLPNTGNISCRGCSTVSSVRRGWLIQDIKILLRSRDILLI